jgi:vacuolar-type H+-ATPase subunit I/STV1
MADRVIFIIIVGIIIYAIMQIIAIILDILENRN